MSKHIVEENFGRVDAIAKLTGAAKFTGDLKFPRELATRIVRSTQAHAIIQSIDISKALNTPGVRGVVIGQDSSETVGVCIKDQPPLARQKVRFVGEPVAVVVAETKEIALQAAQLVKITYSPLPVLLESKEAMSPTAVLIHDDIQTIPGFCPKQKTNIFHHYQIRQGNVEKAFQECPHKIQSSIRWPHLAHCQMEPHVTLCRWGIDNSIELYTSAQSPFDVRHFISEAFHVPMRKVSVATYFLGGGFGGKSDVTIEPLAVFVAKHFPGEYIRIQLEREEMFEGTVVGRGLDGEFEVAFDHEGKIHGLKMTYILNSGGYAGYAINIVQPGGIVTTGTYYIPNLQMDAYGVYTNRPPLGAYRAYGHPEAALLAERMMELIARKLNLDSIEIRKRNMIQVGQSNSIGQKYTLEDGRIQDCMDWVVKDIQAYAKDHSSANTSYQHKQHGKMLQGIGIGNLLKAPGMPTNGFSTAVIRFNEDATANLMISATDMGQGLLTTMTQLASKSLQIPAKHIEINAIPDTRYTPYEWQTVASRSTWMVGNAVHKACQEAIYKFRQNASLAMGLPVEDMIYDGQHVYYALDHARRIPISKLTLGYTFPNGRTVGSPPFGYGYYVPEMEYPNEETGQGNLAAQWTYGCQGVVVDVDVCSGNILVRLVSSALDIGKVINHTMAISQVEGAVIMGIGGTILEHIQYDDKGRIRNREFTDYKIPTPEDSCDVEMHTHFVESYDGKSFYGAKCLGEHPIIGIAPAILAAVYDATGLDFDILPLTAENVRAKILQNYDIVQKHIQKKRADHVSTVSLL